MDAGEPRRGSEISACALRALSEHDRPRRPLGSAQQARVSDDPARGVLPALRPCSHLRRQLSRYRFRRTITGPRVVGRMTSSIDVKMGEKVLEIGTGSGYQSAYLSNLTDKVWTIEIIKPLAERTRGLYDSLIQRGYTEYKAITSKYADGYYGWEQDAPF